MKRIFLILICTGLVAGFSQSAEVTPLMIATFDVDATPPVGSEMAYDPVRKLDEITLRCRGIVFLGAGKPIVLCAIDWLGVANESQDVFRDALAEAAGTTRNRVAVHALHQHDSPRSDFTAEAIVKELDNTGFHLYDGNFQRKVINRAADALKAALTNAQPITHYGWAAVDVKKVASNRRILGEDGKVRVMRFTTARDPLVRAEPEGVIDPEVSLLSFWNEENPVAILSYFACHPQSYYRTGIPSPDFPGIARFLRGQSQPAALHVHFNGAGGNIGAGKYNDGNTENRRILAQRLEKGLRNAWTSTEKFPLTSSDIAWETSPVKLPLAEYLKEESLEEIIKTQTPEGFDAIRHLAFLRRAKSGHAIDIACLRIGRARVLHMPGELFVEYQLAAKAMRPDLQVAMAAYGDYGTAYIGTEISYTQGGYETSDRASNVGPGSEAILMDVMARLLGKNNNEKQ